MFPKDNTIAGNILLKKVSDNTKTEGLIDIDRTDRNIPQDYNEDSTLLLSLYDYSVTWNITIENGYITSYHVSTFEGHASYGGFTKK